MKGFKLVILVLGCLVPFNLAASQWKEKGEAEGKMVFYATFNASGAKALIEGFRQLYPKIDAAFSRTTDAQLMERILYIKLFNEIFGGK